jgi:hypothetical protein
MKKCSKCKTDKHPSEFGKDKYAKDGLQYQCKNCVNSTPKAPRKKIVATCKGCGEKRTVDYYSYQRRKSDYCLRCNATMTQTGVKKPHLSGENSARWKGGEYISSDGYEMVKCEGEEHPSGRVKYKRKHVLVMEEHIGRELKTQAGHMGEQVHHIDGDKRNNDIANLLLCEDTREHKNVDCQLHALAFELVRAGVITFDHETKLYSIDWTKICS